MDAFNPDLLPPVLRAWLLDCQRRIGAPLDFFAVAAMVLASSLVGRRLGIYPKRHDDWLVIPNLWGALIGLPSSMKSPALAEVMKALGALLDQAGANFEMAQADYETQCEQYEVKLLAAKDVLKTASKRAGNPTISGTAQVDAKNAEATAMRNLADLQATKPKPPTKARYKTEDATIEKLAELLIENPDGLLYHRDELTSWLHQLDDKDHGRDRPFFLEAWDGSQGHEVDRIGRGSIYVKYLCVSVLGGIQPGPLSACVRDAMTDERGNDGLLQRLQLLVHPDPSDTAGLDTEPDMQAPGQCLRGLCRFAHAACAREHGWRGE